MQLVSKSFEELTNYELLKIYQARVKIFVVEQNCPYQEIDDKDPFCYHLFYLENDEIIAYIRVVAPGISFETASIGRVLSFKRRSGIASNLMKEGIKLAKEKFKANEITIEAQVYAKEFYEKLGFSVISSEFLEDNIPHVLMKLEC